MTHNRPCIDSQEASPATFDSHLHHRDDINQLSSVPARTDHDDDDDDEMDLGDEASGFIGNMSDDDGNHPHSMNVSPTMEDDNDDSAPELVDHKPLRTPPVTPPSKFLRTSNSIDHQTGYRFTGLNDRQDIPTVSNNYSSVGRIVL